MAYFLKLNIGIFVIKDGNLRLATIETKLALII